MACSGCGADTILVYSGILNGNLCQSCYYKYGINNRDARQKELEKCFFMKAEELGIGQLINKELIRLHSNFMVCPDKTIGACDNQVWVRFKMQYRGKLAEVEITGNTFTKGNLSIKEKIKYTLKDGSTSVVENIYYENGTSEQRKVKPEGKKVQTTVLEILTANNEKYTIDAKTGNLISGIVHNGVDYEQRNYGNSAEWRVTGLWTMKGGKMTRLNITPYQLAGAVKGKKTQAEKNEVLLYKNGKPKYGIIDVDHGDERLWVSLEKRGIKDIVIKKERV